MKKETDEKTDHVMVSEYRRPWQHMRSHTHSDFKNVRSLLKGLQVANYSTIPFLRSKVVNRGHYVLKVGN